MINTFRRLHPEVTGQIAILAFFGNPVSLMKNAVARLKRTEQIYIIDPKQQEQTGSLFRPVTKGWLRGIIKQAEKLGQEILSI